MPLHEQRRVSAETAGGSPVAAGIFGKVADIERIKAPST
jgi:hypothetical protein